MALASSTWVCAQRPTSTNLVTPPQEFGDGRSIRFDTTLTVEAGGQVGDRFVVLGGANLIVDGGSVGDRLDMRGSLYLHDGVIGDDVQIDGNAKIWGGRVESISRISRSLELYEGHVGPVYHLRRNSTGGVLDVHGGVVEAVVYVGQGTLNLHGGVVGRVGFTGTPGEINFYGTDFEIDGLPPEGYGAPGYVGFLTLEPGSRISGVLADGTPFFYRMPTIGQRKVTFWESSPPTLDTSALHITDASQLQGIYGRSASVVTGGSLRDSFRAGQSSAINILGGAIGDNFLAFDSAVSITDGTVGDSFEAQHGSSVDITGGSIGKSFSAYDGATVRISGGNFGSNFRALPGSAVTLVGGDFRIDGEIIDLGKQYNVPTQIDVEAGSVLTGTLVDGTPFARGTFFDGSLLLELNTLPPAIPTITIDSPSDLSGIRNEQQLSLHEGGTLGDYFTASWGSKLHIDGGLVGSGLLAVGSEVRMTSGKIGDGSFAYPMGVGEQAVLEVSGGEIEDHLQVLDGGEATVTNCIAQKIQVFGGGVLRFQEGSTATEVRGSPESRTHISGGDVQSTVFANNAHVEISGGTIGDMLAYSSSVAAYGPTISMSSGDIQRLRVLGNNSKVTLAGGSVSRITAEGGTLTLVGQKFELDGVLVEAVEQGGTHTVTTRQGVLSGYLADGSPIRYDLGLSGDHQIYSGAVLVLASAVPEPTSLYALTSLVITFIGRQRRRRSGHKLHTF